MHCGHHIGVGSLTGYIGEAMNGPPFSLAFVMVKESFVFPAIFFYLESAATNKDRGGTTAFHKNQPQHTPHIMTSHPPHHDH
jgi:hypothetical protein